MAYTVGDILDFVDDNDVKFVRLAFSDLFGTLKNMSVIVDQLERVLEEGICFDGSAVPGFGNTCTSDLRLFPDPSTLTTLPWRPQQGRVVRLLCDIVTTDNTPFIYDTRNVLKKALARCHAMGYKCQIGVECEFYLFKTDENGSPTRITHDAGGYFDIAPLDKGANVRREICLCLEEMGLQPITSHHERGPGQHEVDFKSSDVLSAADNFLTFKAVVKAIAARNGLFASFMPKPITGKDGSGLRTNISLFKDGTNVFRDAENQQAETADFFITGLLNRAPEITAFLNPTANSYERFKSLEVPKYVSWSHRNRKSLIRMSDALCEKPRVEICSPDPTINPYLAFALLVNAGLEGIENKQELTLPCDIKMSAPNTAMLPQSLDTALELSGKSVFSKKILGPDIFENYLNIKKAEAAAYKQTRDIDIFYLEKYFNIL